MPALVERCSQVLQGPVGITFGVTSKGVYFRPNARTIKFLDAATGNISTIAGLDKGVAGTGMCVLPDDADVVWQQAARFSLDLMLVEGFRLAGTTRTREPVDRGCGPFDAPNRAILIR